MASISSAVKFETWMAEERLSTEEGYSVDVSDFVDKCLRKKPEERPTVNMLLNHPFITKYRNIGAREYEAWYTQVLDSMQNSVNTTTILGILS